MYKLFIEKKMKLLFITLFACYCYAQKNQIRYTADWNSLDSRPLPVWYDQAKIGIFIHWGVFSVPSRFNEWFWWQWKGNNPYVVQYMQENYPPDFTYADFAKEFRAELWNPAEWAQLFQASGAKYVVLTSKHHEGYTLWPSKNSWNWNAMDVGANRDLVGDLAAFIRNSTDLKFGLYHSLFEWFNPLYLQDRANGFKTQYFVEAKTMPELYDIVNRYQPEVIWSDGDWEASDAYWNSTEFLAWLFTESPVNQTVVVNDRWGSGDTCHHGSYYTCSDNYNPGVLQNHKWENCMTLDRLSWGYRRDMYIEHVRTIQEVLTELTQTISCGGNILINVGPTKDGILVPAFQERLLQLGQWLSINGEAIYSSSPWKHQNDTVNKNVWYTQNNGNVYAILLVYPQDSKVVLGAPLTTKTTMVSLLGYTGSINWMPVTTGAGLTIDFSNITFANLPSEYAWVFKLQNVQ